MNGHALGLTLDEKEGDAFLAFTTSARGDDHVVGVLRVRHEKLDAVKLPPAAGGLRAQGHPARVPARGWFGEGERGPCVTRRDRAERRLLLRLGANFDQSRNRETHSREEW